MTSRMQQVAFSEDDIIRSICKDSYFEFVKELWGEIISEEPVWNWHIEYLCDELQYVAELVFAGEPKEYDLIINVPPGSTKSTVASVLFAPWTFTRMASSKHICGSHTHELVLDLSRKSRDVVRSEKYQRLWPHISLREDQDTKGYWTNMQGGMRFSCTVGGKTPTGFHGHFLTVDDPTDPDKAVSTLALKAANRWMTTTLPTRKIDKVCSVTILIMQRLHQDDPAGHRMAMTDAGPVKVICLPAEDCEYVQPKRLRKKYVDGLLDPVRLPWSVLKDAKATLGNYGYSGQYMQHPVPLGGGMFKANRLGLGELPPDKGWTKIVRYWDKAYTQEGGAFTVGCKMGVRTERGLPQFWVLDIRRGQWSSDEREKIIRQTAEADGHNVMIGVEQEPAAGKESAENTVRGLAGFRVRLDRRGGASDQNKELRADPYSVQVNYGNVHLAPGNWNAAYIDEMTYFPNSTYKDQIDASSGAFAMLVKKKIMAGAL